MLHVEAIGQGITRLRMESWTGRIARYDASAYILRDVLIDSGFPKARGDLLRALEVLRPRGAVITHWHEDHAGNAAHLAERGIPLRMQPLAEAVLRERPAIGLYRRAVWGRPARLEHALRAFDVSPLKVIDTPGHTRDHVIVWDAERDIVASGDLFLGVKVRIAHAHEEPRALVRSLRMVATLRPRLLLDAHRGPIRDPVQVLHAKIEWMEDTIGEIERLHALGVGMREIQRRVLGREEFTGYVSRREYSRYAFVTSVLAERSGGEHAGDLGG